MNYRYKSIKTMAEHVPNNERQSARWPL